MALFHIKPWEPEETVGTLWHSFVSRPKGIAEFPDSAAVLDVMRTRMGVLYRGLGGAHGVSISAATGAQARNRRTLFQQIGHREEMVVTASFNGDALSVPARIAVFSDRIDNQNTYLWLAAWGACGERPGAPIPDALKSDLLRLRAVRRSIAAVGKIAPGLGRWYKVTAARHAERRQTTQSGADEEAIACIVTHLLDNHHPLSPRALELSEFVFCDTDPPPTLNARTDYRPFKPELLWPEWRVTGNSASRKAGEDAVCEAGAGEEGERRRARRHWPDQTNRRDPLILHRFETIKSWAEMLNLGRKVEDSDEEQARKAASDQEELGLSDIDKAVASRVSFSLDLSPEDVERERLAVGLLYPEWDFRSAIYLAEQVRVLESSASVFMAAGERRARSPAQERRIARVRRQFEALMPRHVMKPGEMEGSEIDIEQAVRSACDLQAGIAGDGRIFRKLTGKERDLSVATLFDASRSTESVVEEQQVIEIAREAILALMHGLRATGDRHAIYSFSSLRRERVFVNCIKTFSAPVCSRVEQAIDVIKPGHYTRLGAAIRHVSARLNEQPSLLRLLLIVTDGKPNDSDYYEGRYGIEDSRRAVMEARSKGAAVFAITIDKKAESYVPFIFGRNGYTIINHPARLAEALPAIYRHLLT